MPWGAVVSLESEQACYDGGSSDVAPAVSSWANVAAVALASSSSSNNNTSNNTFLVPSVPSELHAEQGDPDECLDLEKFQERRRGRGRPSRAVAELLSKSGARVGDLQTCSSDGADLQSVVGRSSCSDNKTSREMPKHDPSPTLMMRMPQVFLRGSLRGHQLQSFCAEALHHCGQLAQSCGADALDADILKLQGHYVAARDYHHASLVLKAKELDMS
eukprot:4294843-Amphidinium_carterae.2